jgi:ribosomal protein S18 acetylase RimI-like enzyme
MTLTYRQLTAADALAYRAIRLESLRLHPTAFGSSYAQQSQLPKLMFERELEQPSDARFVLGVYDGEQLVGICGFIPFAFVGERKDETTGTIIQMYVKPAYRGRKVGLALINATVTAGFAATPCTAITLEVHRDNIPAIRVYEQAGFETVAAVPPHGLHMVLQRPS